MLFFKKKINKKLSPQITKLKPYIPNIICNLPLNLKLKNELKISVMSLKDFIGFKPSK